MADIFPKDNLFRGRTPGVELVRADDVDDDSTDGSLMVGHFAVFDTWTEIHSWFEGDFVERLAPGAFTKTMNEQRSDIKVQFDHGYDPHVADALLGPIDTLRETDEGAYYEVPLLDTDYNRDRILPMLQGRLMNGEQRGSLLGASFRFRVTREEWVQEPKKSDHNPDALPERTIREVRLYEFGPVVFPAYAEATAGVRSLTDHFIERQRERRSVRFDASVAGLGATTGTSTVTPAEGHLTEPTRSLVMARAQTTSIKLRRGAL